MTEIMAQHALSLSPPVAREDVVSALLADYGNSFGHEGTSTSTYRPVSTSKPLPSAPRGADGLRNETLPAVQRMAAKFQLRYEDAPLSPNSMRKNPSTPRPRKKIVSRTLSREGKPASLKLKVSNGSTATVPLTPARPAPALPQPSLGPYEVEDLPPPPPEKSAKRKSSKRAMGNQQSAGMKDLARNDSLLSRAELKNLVDMSSPLKSSGYRKPLSTSTVKKSKSMAELGNAPRSVGYHPMPANFPPRNQSIGSQITVPTVPKQAFTGPSLPSNPRPKAPMSPLHLRGKSSTGFDILKMGKPATTMAKISVNPITPEMTPSPKLRPYQGRNDMMISPASPLPPPLDQHRQFGFEARSAPQKGPAKYATRPVTSAAGLSMPVAPTEAQKQFNSGIRPSTAPTQPGPHLLHSPPASPPASPPFISLTRQPIPMPESLITQISPAHLQCYTSHKTSIWSNNLFQPMGCMICLDNAKDRKWACTWCQLRICRTCSEELRMIPGKSLALLLNSREEAKLTNNSNPGIVVSSADDEYEQEVEREEEETKEEEMKEEKGEEEKEKDNSTTPPQSSRNAPENHEIVISKAEQEAQSYEDRFRA